MVANLWLWEQEAMKTKEEELEAVRGGASVESSLASTALRQVSWRLDTLLHLHLLCFSSSD